MHNDTEYLQPNFDPTSLPVRKLRGILLCHDVEFRPSAKKAELVGLVLEHITPKAKEFLKERGEIVPSSEGIEIIGDDDGKVQPQIYLEEVLNQIFLS